MAKAAPPESSFDRFRTRARKAPAPIWQGQDYPKHEEGVRMVRFHTIQGPEWVRRFRRWSVRLEGHLTDEPGTVSYFMNMGNDPKRPRVGRHSNYYKSWTLANGGPPKIGEEMNPKIFLGKFFRARIEDCKKDSDDKDKPEGDVYSHITELLELVMP